MTGTDKAALAAALHEVAKGAIPLSELAGLGAEDLAQILGQAIAQMQIGRDDKAIPVLEVLVALDEKNAVFQEYLGLAHERLGHHDEALTAYSKNIEALGRLTSAGERLCEGHLLRARLFAQRGEMKEAATDVAAAKQFDTGRDPELAQEIAVLAKVVGEVRS